MRIKRVKVENFRALEKIEVDLSKFSVIIGENDVGKTSFLFALDAFFSNGTIDKADEFFKFEKKKPIQITISFADVPDQAELKSLLDETNCVTIQKTFEFEEKPTARAIFIDGKYKDVPPATLKKWFGPDRFHFIPVRRDLAVQFSMNKTALLGKLLRAKMKSKLQEPDSSHSLKEVIQILEAAIQEPRQALEMNLREQMHNETIVLKFVDLDIDPVEGVTFDVRISDDRVENIQIKNRGAGTQNNLIIALFRLVASLDLGENFIFAMEEPENSLHPKAQRQLLSVLQEISKTSQVICTTHSPVFVDRSKFENNILMNRAIKGHAEAKTFNVHMLRELRVNLGIKPSDALLKGGGNCAILVEGNTEEDGFPIFMEMLGMSEFQLGIAIINMNGPSKDRLQKTATLLNAYDIPCIIVLDKDMASMAEDLDRERGPRMQNIKKIFCLNKGSIEDYYPLDVVADVINSEFSPESPVSEKDFDADRHGKERCDNFKKVMFEHGAGEALSYLKRKIGAVGTKILKDKNLQVDPDLKQIFDTVKLIACGEYEEQGVYSAPQTSRKQQKVTTVTAATKK